MDDTARIFEYLGRLDERTTLILEQTQATNTRVISLEIRVDKLESTVDTTAGASKVKKSILSKGWEIGKIVLAACIGGILGKLVK